MGKLEKEWISRINKGRDPFTDLPNDSRGEDIDFINSKLNKTMFSGEKFRKFINEDK